MSIRKTNTELRDTATNILLYCAAFLLGMICIIGLSSILLTAYYGVPVGDDYMAIKTFADRHTWVNEAWYSLTHTGRYMQSVAASVAYGAFDSKVAVILPLITLGWLYTLIYLYCRLITGKLKIPLSVTQGHFIAAMSTVVIVTAGRVIDPRGVWLLYQPFFFSSAIVTYTVGALAYLTLFYIYIRFAGHFSRRPVAPLVIFALITYLLGLFNETAPATMATFATLIIAISYIRPVKFSKLRSARPYLFSLIGTSFLALITMYLSPSGAARRHATGAMQSDSSGIISPIVSDVIHAASTLVYRPSDLIFIAAIASLVYFYILKDHGQQPSYRWATVIGAVILIASLISLTISIAFLVLGYGVHTGIYPRTFLIFQLAFYVGALVTSIGLVGLVMQSISRYRKWGAFAAAALTLTALVIIAPHMVAKLSDSALGAATYRQVWVEQDKTLRQDAATHPDETVYLDDAGAGIGDAFSVQCKSPFSSSTMWLTDSMEAYYGVREICSKTDLGKP